MHISGTVTSGCHESYSDARSNRQLPVEGTNRIARRKYFFWFTARYSDFLICVRVGFIMNLLRSRVRFKSGPEKITKSRTNSDQDQISLSKLGPTLKEFFKSSDPIGPRPSDLRKLEWILSVDPCLRTADFYIFSKLLYD